MTDVRLARPLQILGWIFCGALLAAVLAFPEAKGLTAGYIPVVVGGAVGVWALSSRRLARILDRLARLSTAEYLTLTLGVAAVVRIAAVLVFPHEPLVDDQQFQRYAVSMLAGHGYGAPGFRAWFPPGMSLLLAAWYALVGTSPLAGKLLHAGIGCALVWQTWAALHNRFPETTARIAGGFVALVPTFVFYTATLGYETVLALLFVVVYRLAMRVSDGDVRVRTLVGLGAVAGCATLVKPIALLVPAVVGAAWWLLGARPLVAFRRSVLVAAAMLVVVSPWTIRNYEVLGRFVLVSTNGGYTLYVANNPSATGLATTRPDPLPGETDEVVRDHLRLRAAVTWIADHPWQWATLALNKVTFTWGTTSSIMSVVSTDRLPAPIEALCKATLNVVWVVLVVLCAGATVRGRFWSDRRTVLPALLIAYVFALHLFFEANSRHHIPVLPWLVVLAVLGLPYVEGSVSAGAEDGDRHTSDPSRRSLGTTRAS